MGYALPYCPRCETEDHESDIEIKEEPRTGIATCFRCLHKYKVRDDTVRSAQIGLTPIDDSGESQGDEIMRLIRRTQPEE